MDSEIAPLQVLQSHTLIINSNIYYVESRKIINSRRTRGPVESVEVCTTVLCSIYVLRFFLIVIHSFLTNTKELENNSIFFSNRVTFAIKLKNNLLFY